MPSCIARFLPGTIGLGLSTIGYRVPVQMERSVTAAEARQAAQQQAASGLDAMLLAIGGTKKVSHSLAHGTFSLAPVQRVTLTCSTDA